MELAWYAEDFLDIEEIIQWFKVCVEMCSRDDDREQASTELNLLEGEIRGAVFMEGIQKARTWMKEGISISKSETLAFNEKKEDGQIKYTGKFHALLIGVKDYSHFPALATPISDIKSVGRELEYKFKASVKYLENPERHEITKQLNLLKNTVKSEDVLLIYYAGHGFLDEKTDEGYWLPADAEEEDDLFGSVIIM